MDDAQLLNTDSAEGNCPNAYAYAYGMFSNTSDGFMKLILAIDESSGTALWTCDSGLGASYTVTFCP